MNPESQPHPTPTAGDPSARKGAYRTDESEREQQRPAFSHPPAGQPIKRDEAGRAIYTTPKDET